MCVCVCVCVEGGNGEEPPPTERATNLEIEAAKGIVGRNDSLFSSRDYV